MTQINLTQTARFSAILAPRREARDMSAAIGSVAQREARPTQQPTARPARDLRGAVEWLASLQTR